MSVVSIKQVVVNLRALCNAHTQVNSYFHVNSIVERYKETEIVHATVLSEAKSAVINPTDITVIFDLAVFDKTLKGAENDAEVESNKLHILGDLVNFITQNQTAALWRYANVVGSPSAVKQNTKTLDVCDGWKATIQFRLMKDNGTCDVPIV